MLGERPESSLEDLCDLIVDCPHSTPEWTDSGVVVLRNQYIRGGRLDLSNPSYTTEEGYLARIKRAIPLAGDLVLTREAPMGEVCQIPEGLKCCLGQRMVLLRPAPEKVDSEFLLFSLQSPYLQHQINWSEGTGTTVSNIRLPDLRAFKVPVPSLRVQKTIAGILKALDDKIELNRQINATLESMAQALFKSWFVDFDPVIDNALAAGNPIPEPLQARAEKRAALLAAASAADTRSASATDNAHPTQTAPHTQPGTTAPTIPLQPLPADLRALFPDSFVFNEEMGWVPEGWPVSPLDSLIELIGGGTPKTSIDEYWNGDIPWFSVVDAPNQSDVFALETEKHVTPEGIENSSTKLLPSGTTIISARGTVGKCAVVGKPMAMNQSCYGIRGADGYGDFFTYYTVLLRVADLQQHSHGSVFSTITRDTFRSIKSAACPPGLSCVFDKMVAAYMSKIKLNLQSIQALSELRDALLPKLLSGQIQLPEVERKYAEAAQ